MGGNSRGERGEYRKEISISFLMGQGKVRIQEIREELGSCACPPAVCADVVKKEKGGKRQDQGHGNRRFRERRGNQKRGGKGKGCTCGSGDDEAIGLHGGDVLAVAEAIQRGKIGGGPYKDWAEAGRLKARVSSP